MQISLYGFEKITYARDLCRAFLGDIKVSENGEDLKVSCEKIGNDQFCATLDDGKKRLTGKSELFDHPFDTPTRAACRALYSALGEMTGEVLPWGTLTGVRPTKIYWSMKNTGLSDEKLAEAFRKIYLVSAEKTEKLLQTIGTQKQIVLEGNSGVNLYISIPFCPSRCAYCSFISNSVEKGMELLDRFLVLLFCELEMIADLTDRIGLPIKSIYVGGGTPSVLCEESLRLLLEKIKVLFFKEGIEYTFEAGRPDTVTESKLALLKAYNVNRISINPQTFHDETLRIIGRNHTKEDIFNAFKIASPFHFPVTNSDIIAGLPKETEKDFIETLDHILLFAPENITVHTLSFKRGAFLWDVKEGDKETVKNMLDAADQKLKENGYFPYYLYRQKNMLGNFENTGYAKNNTVCRYNVITMEENQSIIGAGAGAITKMVSQNGQIKRFPNPKYPNEYIEKFHAQKHRIDSMYSFFISGGMK